LHAAPINRRDPDGHQPARHQRDRRDASAARRSFHGAYPIIALSANAVPRDIAKALDAGFFSYITKPIKVEHFMETLDVAMKHSQATSARAAAADHPR